MWLNFVFAQCVGFTIHALYLATQAVIPRTKWRTRSATVVFWGIVPIAGVTIGYAIAATLLGWTDFLREMFTPRGLATMAVMALIISAIILAILVPMTRAARAATEIANEKARVAAAERETALAQMKALQAQVEPHFLYNTLAHVASLVDRDPAQARAMLDRLIALLRSTAKASNGVTTLGGQAELLRAYLDILAMRMGSRLKWTIDVPRSLADVALPPALLQPLVENAIKHGLEPNIDGGSIAIAAQRRRRPARADGDRHRQGIRFDDSADRRVDAARTLGAEAAARSALRGCCDADDRREPADGRAGDAHDPVLRDAMNDARRPTAIIADDETRLAEFLKERLAAVWPELVIAGIAANGAQAQALLASEGPDIAFLDIRMPGLTGLDVARGADPDVHIVFVTAFDQYAVDAFEREACDYLLKPVSDERLAQTCERLRRRLADRQPAPGLATALAALAQAVPSLRPPGGRLGWLRAAVGQEVRLISVDDVCYFEANDKYTSVFTADAEALIRTPLKELVAQLDPDRFWQVHRGTVVNLAHVVSTRRDLSRAGHARFQGAPRANRRFARLRAPLQADVSRPMKNVSARGESPETAAPHVFHRD